MSEQTMVERVAAAILPGLTGSREDALGRDLPDIRFEDLVPDWQERTREIARAAIAAMREPTEAMLEEGRWVSQYAGARAYWQAMIDAALSEIEA